MTPPLRRLADAMIVGFLIVAGGLIYWQVVAASGLTTDPRYNGYRAAEEIRQNQRGRIVDRAGQPIVVSERARDGGYDRRYVYPPLVAATGYWSLRYGTTGIEGAYDGQLSGNRAAGLPAIWQRLLHRPVVGADVVTTLDLRIQRAADEALGDRAGAAVAIDPRTGEVLALVSHPYADPNRIDAEFERLRANRGDPLFNRATSGLYVPGSTFKTVTFTGALAAGIVKPDRVFEDPDNGIVVDHYRIPDPNHPGQPRFDALHALAYSSNSAFAEIGMELGRDRLVEQARRFGFEKEIPFDLPTAVSRVATDPNFLWTRLGLATTGIGQGEILASPLQMGLVAAGIANRGVVMRPSLVREIHAPDGGVVERRNPRELGQAASPEVARVVTEAMVLGVRESWGRTAALPNVNVAAKTGTAETDEGAIPHAWFIAFAPAEAPRIAVAVIVEHAGGGSTRAGPIARRVLEVGLPLVAP